MLLLGIAAIGAAPIEAAKAATKNCSAAGLRFTEKQEGVTYSVAVANLKAKVTPCPKARTVARTVAKDILGGTEVPATVGGLKVTVKEPCVGCTPDSQVTAKAGQELVTFTVKGGA
ncbi:MAG: hypothetical protein J0H06_12370 [Actinobacteria bacterium]|nr:hypothetical protein [Actinomycetota bacterium]